MAERGSTLRRIGIGLLILVLGAVVFAATHVMRNADEAHAVQATAEAAKICKAVLSGNAKDCAEAMAVFDADPWGRPYQCELFGPLQARVTCVGRDGYPGGDGPDADHVCEPKPVGGKQHCLCDIITTP